LRNRTDLLIICALKLYNTEYEEIISSSLLLLAVSTGWGAVQEAIPVMNAAGVMKALPIYSNELIDKAPEGEAITGIRDCYTSYFLGGVNYRDFEKWRCW